MPVLPDYDAHEGVDPGNGIQVSLDKSVAQAGADTGAALQSIGSNVTELFDHLEKRQEQKENFAASVGLQSLTENINAADAKAASSMPLDGNGWAKARTDASQGLVNNYVSALPERLQETYGLKAGLLAQKMRNDYAAQEAAQVGKYYTNVATQEQQKAANSLYAGGGASADFEIARDNINHQVDNIPNISPDQREALRQKFLTDAAEASLRGAADKAAQTTAAAKVGVVGPGGTYATPPAGGLRPATAPDGTVAYVPPVQDQSAAPSQADAPQTADDGTPMPPRRPADLSAQATSSRPTPDQQYANIPDVDDKGRAGQKAKMIGWNSDPIGNDQAKFAQLQPGLQAIISRARQDNPDLHFVVGSGLRTQADEDKAAEYGWSPKSFGSGGGSESLHKSGAAADLWPIDERGRVDFDHGTQVRVAQAMKRAAQELGVPMQAGADFRHADMPHFQVSPGAAPQPPARPADLGGQQDTIPKPTVAAYQQQNPGGGTDAAVVTKAAADLGTTPHDLAMVIGYETAGTYSPKIWGGTGKRYLGLIQFSPDNQAKYGVHPGQSFAEQMPAVVQYLKDRGYKPGMGLADLYSTINAGRPGLYDASDRPNATVSTHVANMQRTFEGKVTSFLGGKGTTLGGPADGQPVVGARGPSDAGGHFGLDPNDPRLAMIPWQQRRAIEMDAMRGAEAAQTYANTQASAQHASFMNQLELQAHDGKIGQSDIDNYRRSGQLTQYGDVTKIEEIIKSKQDKNDDLASFNQALATPGFVFNPVDKGHQKQIDAGYDAMTKVTGDPIGATQRVVERTGMVPSQATTALRGALISGDPARAQAALGVTGNILRTNPNILDASPGGEKLAKQANTFAHYTNDMGMSGAQATQKIVEAETPEYQRKLALALKDQDISQVVKQNLSVGDLESAFNVGLPYFGRPSVSAAQPRVQAELMGDYEDWFRIHYGETGDANLSKSLAQADLKKVWGLTGVTGTQVFTRYPIEQAPAYAGIDDVSGKVADAARTAIKDGTGQDVPREKLILAPSTATPDEWKAGRAPPMTLQWMDGNGHMQIAPRPLVVDPGVIRFKQSLVRQEQFDAARAAVVKEQANAPQQLDDALSGGP